VQRGVVFRSLWMELYGFDYPMRFLAINSQVISLMQLILYETLQLY